MLDPEQTDDPAFWDSVIAQAKVEPAAWRHVAVMLKRASDTLANQFQSETHASMKADPSAVEMPDSPSVGPVYMMLAGLALENLAKGIVVQGDPSAVDGLIGVHLSVDLIARAGISLSESQSDLVGRLATFISWAGRYPVPKQKHAGKLAHRGFWAVPWRVSTGDVAEIDELVRPDGCGTACGTPLTPVLRRRASSSTLSGSKARR